MVCLQPAAAVAPPLPTLLTAAAHTFAHGPLQIISRCITRQQAQRLHHDKVACRLAMIRSDGQCALLFDELEPHTSQPMGVVAFSRFSRPSESHAPHSMSMYPTSAHSLPQSSRTARLGSLVMQEPL